MAAPSPTAGSVFGEAADNIWQAMEQLRARFDARTGGSTARHHDVRRAVLALLTEEPMHGYRIIHEIAVRSGGAWTPNAGAVYPTLQLLADEGLIAAETVDGRKTYALTELGRAEVAREGITAPWTTAEPEQAEQHERRDVGALPKAGLSLAQAAAQVGRTGTPAQIQEAVTELEAARRRLYAILARE